MRRVEIIDSIVRVQNALSKSGLTTTVIGRLTEREGKETGKILLQALRDYSLLIKDFGTAEKQITKILQLDILEDIDFWVHAVTRPEDPPVMHTLYNRLGFVEENLSKFIKLLETDAIQAARETSDKAPTDREGRSVLSVIVIENPKQLSRPTRLINILESITLLYEANAILLNVPSESLSVIGCDSGSDKAFDFLGLANVMENIKDVILSLWDRIVFFREQQVAVRNDLILESLPIVERIAALQGNGSLEPEQAAILKRNVIQGCTKFMDSGAIIPEIQSHTSHNPRLLMRPQPKLLAAGTDGDDEEDVAEERSPEAEGSLKENFDSVDTSALTPEDTETLKTLLGKVKKKKNPKKKKK